MSSRHFHNVPRERYRHRLYVVCPVPQLNFSISTLSTGRPRFPLRLLSQLGHPFFSVTSKDTSTCDVTVRIPIPPRLVGSFVLVQSSTARGLFVSFSQMSLVLASSFSQSEVSVSWDTTLSHRSPRLSPLTSTYPAIHTPHQNVPERRIRLLRRQQQRSSHSPQCPARQPSLGRRVLSAPIPSFLVSCSRTWPGRSKGQTLCFTCLVPRFVSFILVSRESCTSKARATGTPRQTSPRCCVGWFVPHTRYHRCRIIDTVGASGRGRGGTH